MGKRVILDNSGVVVSPRKPTTVHKKDHKIVTTVDLASTITADFIREIKNELVQELSQLLSGLTIESSKKPEEVRDSFKQSDIVIKPIEIDESVVVTEVKVGEVEKGFSELTETQVTADNISQSIDKLRLMKKGN